VEQRIRRKLITIDEEKCTGCGLCVPDCPEGALQIIDGKARLVSEPLCDGLGACLGACPEGAITVEEKDAVPYDEKKVMENIVRHGENVLRAHLEHLRDHGQTHYLEEALEFLRHKNIPVPPGFLGHLADLRVNHPRHVCYLEDIRLRRANLGTGPTRCTGPLVDHRIQPHTDSSPLFLRVGENSLLADSMLMAG